MNHTGTVEDIFLLEIIELSVDTFPIMVTLSINADLESALMVASKFIAELAAEDPEAANEIELLVCEDLPNDTKLPYVGLSVSKIKLCRTDQIADMSFAELNEFLLADHQKDKQNAPNT